MKTENYRSKAGFQNQHSIEKAVRLQNDEHTQIIHMTLQPGDKVKEHKTPFDVSFFVIEGSVEMKVGEEIERVDEGTNVGSPANIVHSFKNKDDQPARVLVIKHLMSK